MKVRKIALALAAGAAITIAAVAYAHPGGWGMGGYGPGAGYGHGAMMGGGYGHGAMMGGGYGPGAMMGGGYGPGAGHGPGAMMGGGYGPGAMMGGYGPGANADAWLEQYKAQLQITPAQEGAWTAYTKQAKEQFEARRAAHEAMFASMQDPKLTAPERAALKSAMMQQRAGAMVSSAAALKDLYAALSPEQRALLDQGPGAGYRRR